MERIKPGLVKRIHLSKLFAYICFVLLISVFLASCSGPSSYVQKGPAKGVYHRVKKGETFWSIARSYHIKVQELAEVNNINNPDLIEDGSVLFIPDANQVIDDVLTSVKTITLEDKVVARADNANKVKPLKDSESKKNSNNSNQDAKSSGKRVSLHAVPPENEKLTMHEDSTATESTPERNLADAKIERKSKSKSPAEEKEEIQFEKKRFIWPVRGSVKTRFGIQPNKPYHNYNWIKIVSAMGSQVKSAASGTVIFSSTLPSFGETIIIRHADNFATVYAHLKTRYVKPDKIVKNGDIIAIMGETDEAGDAYMNFEVRLRGKARNPLFFLP